MRGPITWVAVLVAATWIAAPVAAEGSPERGDPSLAVSSGSGVPSAFGHAGAGADLEFHGSVSTIPRSIRRLMRGSSWRPGCPVGFDKLRLVRVTYRGFDREAHSGRLVVHRNWADEILATFRAMYEARFTIRRVRLVDRYGADDRRSMAADNTSAFNCRYRAGVCCIWSEHAYGKAIDINPVENPFVYDGGFAPPAGERYLDRSRDRRGMIHHGDEVWDAFRDIGWPWGGDWEFPDYQHFSWNGR